MSSQWQRPEQDPFARVWDEVKKVRAESAQRVNYLLRNAGLRVAEGALHVLQRLVVEGDQEVTGSLDVSGDATFTGDTAIGGRLDVTGQTAIGGTLDVTGETTLGGATTISGDTDVTGDLSVTGDLEVTGPASFESTLDVGGTATVQGQLRSQNFAPGASGWRLTSTGLEVNDILLRGGIIGNDALTSPVTFRSSWGSSEAFAMPGGSTQLAHCQITIPAGFNQMLFYTTASLRARNDEGSWEFLRARIDYQVNNTGPIRSTVPTRVDVQNGRPGTVVVPGIWSEPVNPGDVWRFWVDGWTQEPWSADSDNYAVLEVACLFTR